MEMLTVLIALSAIMWYLINRGKEEIWGQLSFSKWVTIGVSAAFGFAIVFAFNLDLIFACNLAAEITILGKVITALALMSGSSGISEIIERINNGI